MAKIEGYHLQQTGDEVQEILNTPVKTIQQTLTEGQKAQARENIGAGDVEYYDVIYDVTTQLELREAYNAGKTLRLVYQGKIAPLVYYLDLSGTRAPQPSAVTAIFEMAENGTIYQYGFGTGPGANWETKTFPVSKVVRFVSQSLSLQEQAQARTNIGAGTYSKPSGGIPASDLASGVIPDVSQFITKSVNDLANYYLKSETYTKDEVAALIGAIQQFHYEIYASRQEVVSPANNVLYLIGPTGSGADKYEEYVYDSTKQDPWVKIGDTSIDLSGLVTTEALNTALAAYTTSADLATLLSAKQDTIADLADIRTGSQDNVKYTQQTLTDAQQEQARTNIGATAPEVFWAEYGTTTQAQVQAAVADGKLVACYYNGRVYVYAGESNAGYSQFTSMLYDTAFRVYLKNSSWGNATLDIPTDVVKYAAQSLSDSQKAQARTNIGAGTYSKPDGGIPASDLADGVIPDVSQFITKSVNDLANYYLKSETYTKDEVAALIGAIQQFHYEIAASTSAVTNPQSNVLYLIGPTGSGSDKYEEYVYSNGWVKIGDTSIDLSGYVTTTALNTALAAYTTSADLATLLAGKQDTISDLETIRSGAAAGATAYQKPQAGIPATDLADKYAGSPSAGGPAFKALGIPYGAVDADSTATDIKATVDNFPATLTAGVCAYIRNDVIASASGFTLNINGTGALPVYSTMSDASRATTVFTAASTYLFVYNPTRVEGGCWDIYYGYNANDNTIGYILRTNYMSMPVTSACYRYRLLFTSANGQSFVPANASTSTNATAKRTTTQTPIDPFGSIRYYNYTSAVSSGARPGVAYLCEQYQVTLGYSFNRTGAALTLTPWDPVYIKCAPQSNGSAIIDEETPYVQALPSTEDGKIYIFLGVATSETQVEVVFHHPVYYYKDGAIRLWTNAATQAAVLYGEAQSLTDAQKVQALTNIGAEPSVDRAYNSTAPNGLGYVVLKKDATFSTQLAATNTIYEIRYDFDLSNGSVSVPAGCTLLFNGGSVKNGTLTGNGTTIIAEPVQIFSGITLGGTFKNEYIYAEWCGCKNDGTTDNHDALQAACDNAIRVGVIVQLLPGVYAVDEGKGAVYINFGADGQKFEIRGAGSPYTTIKTADGSIDRFIEAGGDPRYLHTFYHIPTYGGVYSVNYTADTVKFSGLTFDKNKRGTTATPSTAYAWESNNCFHSVDGYDSKTGTVDNYIFDDITLVDKVGSGLTLVNNEAKFVYFHRIVDLQESNDWGYREGIYPLAKCDKVLIEDCSVNYIQVEPTQAQAPSYHSKAVISKCRLQSFEWNITGITDPSDSSLTVNDCIFEKAYLSLSGPCHFLFSGCNFLFNADRQSVIWNGTRFSDCSFYFKWVNNTLPTILHRTGSETFIYPEYDNCKFYTDEIPEENAGSASIFASTTTPLRIKSIKIFRDCEFNVNITTYLNKDYTNGWFKFYGCKFNIPAAQSLFQVGSYASGWGRVDLYNCEVVNNNIIYTTATTTAGDCRGEIVGKLNYMPIVNRSAGSENRGLNGDGLTIEVSSSTAISGNGVALPKGTKVIKNGIVYTMLVDLAGAEFIALTSAYYKCELVNKFMDSTTRTGLTGLPPIPIEAYDTTLNKPMYWTGSAWTDNAPQTPEVSTIPAGGFLPNVLYNLGTLTGNVTFSLAAGTAGVVNHYYWTFDADTTAPNVTWPSGITWAGGASPVVNASKHYEISVLNGIGTYLEV